MSFESVLLVAVLALAALMPIVGVYLFERGYSLGIRDYNNAHRDEMKSSIEKNKPVSVPKQDKRLQELETLMENIENYDGTTAGQKDIEVN